jgi:DNA repair protein RecO (recombination protein O)
MPLITTKALVLRETKYKEADKMLTALTETEGKLSVKAAGALRKGCKFSAATDVLTYSELTLFGKNGRWSINEAQTLEQFLPLRQELSSLSLGIYFAELTEAVSDEDSPNPELLRLCLNALFALSRALFEPEHIKAAFELRLMCLSGYEPALDDCASCGMVDIIEPELSAMRHVCGCEPKRVFSFELGDEAARRRLYAAAEKYALSQLERNFGALDYWKSLK